MKNFLKQIKYFKIKIFILYALLIGIPMGTLCPSACFDISKALFFGIPFGFFMAVFFGRAETSKKKIEEQISTDQDLVLNSSFLPVYLNTFGVFLFFSVMYLFSTQNESFDYETAFVTAAVMGLLLLVFIVSYPTQIIIGKKLIVIRKNGIGSPSQKVFDLSHLKEIKLTRFGKIKLFLNGTKKFILTQEMQKAFSNLPSYNSEKASEKYSKAQNIMNWLQDKANLAPEIDLDSEKARLAAIPRRKSSVLFVFFLSLFGFGFLFVPIFLSSQASLMKIEYFKTGPSQIFYRDVHNAFWFFDSSVRKMYETKWKNACEQNLDYNCRLLSYLRNLEGDQVDALSMLKKSCSLKDPYSCFNIILNDEASPIDIKLAEFQLLETCTNSKGKLPAYCQCTKDLGLIKNQNCIKQR